MLKELMNNPYAWAILSICTVFSFIFGVWQYFKSKRIKQFACYKNYYTIVRAGKSFLPKLELKYNNQEIQELVVTKYAVWNSGNEVLHKADMVESKPLMVLSNDEQTQILDVKILRQNNDTNQFSIVLVDGKCAQIDFDYVNVKDGIVLQIIHTGTAKDLSIDCKIKGGKEVKNLNKDKKTNYNKAVMNVVSAVGVILIGVMMLLLVGFVIISLVDMGQDFLTGIKWAAFAMIYIGVLGAMYYKLLKEVYFIEIPSTLRKAIGNDEFYV